jgi:hypothetical protein
VRALAILVLVACGQPAQRVEVAEPVDVIARDDYASRISGLRATLARSGIELDTAPTIETCHGSDVKGRCVRCELATRERTSGLDPDLLDAVAIAFARYPQGTLAHADIRHVALCRKIRYSDNPDDGPAGLAILGDRRILVSVEHFIGDHSYDSFTIEQIVHHEVFHMFDSHLAHDKEWSAVNPPGFAYKDPAGAERPKGFVDAYATTSDAEDRASTFEYMMGQPDKLCELAAHDPVLAKKIEIVAKRTSGIARRKTCALPPKTASPPKRRTRIH